MKTIAQQLNVKEFPFEIKDHNGNEIYREYSTGNWAKWQYDTNGNAIYYEDSNGFWSKWQYDTNGKLIYCEYSNGDWYKFEYDTNGNKIYYENSYGRIIDERPKEVIVSMDEIADKMGIPVSQLKIKKA